MNHPLNEQLLENVSGAGITPSASKYEIGDYVDFRDPEGLSQYGTILKMYYFASRNRWEYFIKTGILTPFQVPEKDIIGLRRS